MNSKKNANTKTNRFVKNPTFASKLLIKLANSSINPIIPCLAVLKYEPQNRTRREFEKALPWLSTLDELTSYLYLEEPPHNYKKILLEFAIMLFYQLAKPNSIIKRVGDKNNNFFFIFNGGVNKIRIRIL